MKHNIKLLFDSHNISQAGVLDAVSRGWITVDEAVEIIGKENEVEIVRSAKLSEISKACNAKIISGVDLQLTEGSAHFNLTIEDQSNIANLFRVVELGGTEFPYQSEDGVCRIYTAAEIAQIYTTAQTAITTQTTYHNQLKLYVQSLNDVESISKIQYGMTLPEPYLTEMNKKLLVAKQQMDNITGKLKGVV